MFNPAISQRNKELWSLIYTCKRWDLITQHSAIEYRFTKILNKVFTQLKYIIWGFYQVKYTSKLWTNSHPSTMWTLSMPWRLTWPGEGLPSCPSTRIRSLAGSLQIATLLTLLSLCPWPMVGIRCWCLTPTSLSMDGRRRTEEHRSTDWENPGLPSKLTHRDLVHHQDLIHRCETLLIYFSILISLYKGFWYCYAWYGAGCWWSVGWCFQRCCYITIHWKCFCSSWYWPRPSTDTWSCSCVHVHFLLSVLTVAKRGHVDGTFKCMCKQWKVGPYYQLLALTLNSFFCSKCSF